MKKLLHSTYDLMQEHLYCIVVVCNLSHKEDFPQQILAGNFQVKDH